MVNPIQTSAFLPLVAPHVFDAPIPLIERQIRSAAIEFCEKTRCWRHVAKVQIEGNEGVLVAPEWAVIHEFERAEWCQRELTPLAYSNVASMPEVEGEHSYPAYITQTNPGTVTVYPFAKGELELSVWLKPSEASDFSRADAGPMTDFYNQVPDFLLSQHGEAIAWGALARLLALPRQPWTDGRMALFYLERFTSRLDSKSAQNMRGQQRAPKRTRMRML